MACYTMVKKVIKKSTVGNRDMIEIYLHCMLEMRMHAASINNYKKTIAKIGSPQYFLIDPSAPETSREKKAFQEN